MKKSHKAPSHDEYFQENFADPIAAASLVRLAAPPEVVNQLKLDELKPLPASQFDSEMGKRIPDLLFECPSSNGRIVVGILFEHKSRPDYQIAIQLLRYVLLDYEYRKTRADLAHGKPGTLYRTNVAIFNSDGKDAIPNSVATD